jgi:outer membrane protein assembly factor BamB
MRKNYFFLIALVCCLSSIDGTAGDDVAMFGGTPSRNMVSSETGLPSEWEIETGKNILWKQQLGSQSYGGPVVYKDKIYVGTNNEGVRNPELTGDRGNILVFRVSDGKFLWQAAHPKLPAGRVHDWPQQGICSAPLVEGDRLYYVSNRAELICADTEGFLDGENDGPFQEEANTSEIDEDIIWKLDMIGELEVFPHNLAAGSPLMVDDLIFTVTGNGVDEGHFNIPAPLSASFLAVNKKTGGLAWEDASPGPNILHGSWSNPAYGVVNGEAQVFFPGGDGWIYALSPLDGNLLWKFDLNPKDSIWALGGSGTRNNIISTPVFYKNKIYVGVGQDPEHGEGPGNFWVIDATGKGDVTETAMIWHRGGRDFNRSISTVAIEEGLLFVADLSGFLYCLDINTGQTQWVHDTFAAIWGSPFVADGKVYIGDEDGDLVVLKAGRGKQLISEMNMGSSIYTTPVAKNGIIFIATRTMLFALKEGAQLLD